MDGMSKVIKNESTRTIFITFEKLGSNLLKTLSAWTKKVFNRIFNQEVT